MRYSAGASRLWMLFLLILSGALLLTAWPPGKPVQSTSKIPPADLAKTGSSRLAVPQTTQDPSVHGRWGPIQSLGIYTDTVTGETERPVVPIHINLLPNGKLLLWGRDKAANGDDVHGYTHAFLLDPFYMSLKQVRNNRTNLFCSGHSFLPDGRLLVAGGHSTERGAAQEGHGSINTNIFDYRTERWQGNPLQPGPNNPPVGTPPPNMNNGRWYPYNLTLDSGETLVASGSYILPGATEATQNDIAQIYGLDGTLRDVVGLGATYGTSHALRNYPFLHLLPNGQVYVAGSSGSRETWFLNYNAVNGEEAWNGGQFTNRSHWAGTSVQYESGKIINIGGGTFGSQAVNGYETIDLTSDPLNQTWTPLASMGFPRVNHTGTLLPDGKVLVTGGSRCGGFNNHNCTGGPVLTPELWNGTSWQQMANHQVARGYHSTAILLPDGRVMIGGGGLPAADGETTNQGVPCPSTTNPAACRKYGHNEVEIFSPPYLFLAGGAPAPRPSITHAPQEVIYGQTFPVGVGTVRANEIIEVVLVRLGAVTHSFNQDQRRVRLTATVSNDLTLNVTAPADSKMCPPGHYMLFLMKQNGDQKTPSIAKIIRVGKISTAKSIQAFSDLGETREIDINRRAGVQSSSLRVEEVSDPHGFISASITTAGKLSIGVLANDGTTRREGQIKVKILGEPAFDHLIDIYQGKKFTDTTSSPTLYQAASKLNAMKVTAGCDPMSYCPNQNLTREEMAVMLVNTILDGVPPPEVSHQTFGDVEPSRWSHDYIEDLFKRTITSGCGTIVNNKPAFCPTSLVKRVELAVFLLRLLNINPPPPPDPVNAAYSDISTHWGYAYIEEVHKQGLMGGCAQPNMFCPEQPATRAEIAEALAKLLRL